MNVNNLIKKADEFYKKGYIVESKNIYDEILRTNSLKSLQELDILSKLGRCYCDLGYFDVAIDILRDVYNKRKEKFGLNNSITLNDLSHMAICYSEMGDNDKALQLEKKVFFLKKETGMDIVNSLINLGSYFGEAGDYFNAKRVYEYLCLNYLNQNIQIDDEQIILVLGNLSIIYLGLGYQETCLDINYLIYNFFHQEFGEENIRTIQSQLHLVNSYFMLGDYNEGRNVLKNIYSIVNKNKNMKKN
mgnify:CR=1 FL=1